MSYKWKSPLAWLTEKAGTWDFLQLYHEFCAVVQTLDGDEIQELYESEMDTDGYFEVYCGQCHEPIEGMPYTMKGMLGHYCDERCMEAHRYHDGQERIRDDG